LGDGPKTVKAPIPHPKKRLGQNFLHDKNVLDKLVRYIHPSPNDIMLEIGAGAGALTVLLASQVSRLIAVELDETLIPHLEQIPHVEVVHEDIRKLNLKSISSGRKMRVVGNLPYYISTSILTFLIEQKEFIEDLVLMFQEEVAQRIISPASHSEYGLLSVLAQYYCNIERGFPISRNSFVPKPEIQSRVLHFTIRTASRIEFSDYMEFLRKAFSQKRKKLRNNLMRTLQVESHLLDSIFRELKIPENVRAENLTPTQYERLILSLGRTT
jgi:16S rRNA (adenine1518-N6/adenine1519-N6)-dimethyltransferase